MARRILQKVASQAQTELSFKRQCWVKQNPITPLGQRIVAAMVNEFATKGVLGARVSDITRLAGTTDPTFYRYFHGIKQGALFIMSEYYWAPLNLKLNHFLQITTEPIQLFHAVVDCFIQSTGSKSENTDISLGKVFRIVVAQSRNPVLLPESMLEEEYLDFLEKLAQILAMGQQQGVFTNPMRAPVLATQLLTIVHGMLGQNAIPNQFFRVEEVEIRTLAAYLVGLKEPI